VARGLRSAFVLVLALGALAPALPLRAQTGYLVKDLGTLGGTTSGALSVNGRGGIVGYAFFPGNRQAHAFYDDGGGMRDLGTFGGAQSEATHLNEAGDVVGSANLADGSRHAFLWRGGALHDLGTLGGSMSIARWINDRGDVVGSSFAEGDLSERAFLWRDGVLIDLGTLGGTDARAYCVNSFGDIVGFARVPANDELHAALWRHGMLTDLGTLGGWASHAYAINDAGKVCGWSMKVPNYVSHAFVWSEGVTIDLGTLGGEYSAAYALNAHGDVVGASVDAAGVRRAFVWDGQKMLDLNTLIPPGSDWLLDIALAISDDGVIVGNGRRGDGAMHAFKLTPVGTLDVSGGARLAFAGPTPNPARGRATFDLSLARAGEARVDLYDVAGRRVRTLISGPQPAGARQLEWDGRDAGGGAAGAGVYFARFESDDRVITRRFAFAR
jgi:probable HAF family extracellular repeat protein